jgi:hypothetical protein
MKLPSCFGALAVFTVLLPSGLIAGPAISFSGISVNGTDGIWSLGWEFSPTTAIDVTALGFYDATLTGGSIGLGNCTGCGEVGIYNSSGTLLASTLVTTAGSLVADFYYETIPTLALSAGQDYFIVAETGNADYTGSTNTGFTSGFAVSPDIGFIEDAYIASSTLAFPNLTEGITAAEGGGIFGPNFEETKATPEPSTFLLIGAGMLFLLARYARPRRKLVRAN